jgi:glycosyltransferase involved in cell wall biosynthesis
MTNLSVLIPSINERFLCRTVADVLEHSEADTEIVVVVDGPTEYEIPAESGRVRVIELAESIGQRAACNLAARESGAEYVMKADAHCSFGQGFDRIMLEDIEPDMTLVPAMRNLWAFDWVCPNGHRRYQSPSGPCEDCGEPTMMDVVWRAKTNPVSTAMRFDQNLHFQYWPEYKRRQHGDLVETMSLLGACWMVSRERYWDLGFCDEEHGSWGQQGTEVACKTWLSGGRLICDKRAWFAHLFRTQGKDFGFPYPLSGQDVQKARDYSKHLWVGKNWPKAIHDLDWLIRKFAPVPGWETPLSAATLSKGIVYYTDNRLDPLIMEACQRQLASIGLPIISVSLAPIDFGRNIVVDGERGPLTMFRQILAGLEASTADVVFFAEHDVLYHPSHFEFTPLQSDLFYYDNNFWQVDAKTGHALTHAWRSTSGLCAYRDLLVEHYRKRVAMVERDGYSMRMGYEPGSHHRPERVDDYGHEMWHAPFASIDLRHGLNMTPAKWRKEDFRNQRYTEGWQESDAVPGWGETAGRMTELLRNVPAFEPAMEGATNG